MANDPYLQTVEVTDKDKVVGDADKVKVSFEMEEELYYDAIKD